VRIQNEQICAKLLGWRMVAEAVPGKGNVHPAVWHKKEFHGIGTGGGLHTPSFLDFRESAYIIERLVHMGYKVSMGVESDGRASVLVDNGVRHLQQIKQEEPITELIRRVAILVIET
jgi:hypothetical protein